MNCLSYVVLIYSTFSNWARFKFYLRFCKSSVVCHFTQSIFMLIWEVGMFYLAVDMRFRLDIFYFYFLTIYFYFDIQTLLVLKLLSSIDMIFLIFSGCWPSSARNSPGSCKRRALLHGSFTPIPGRPEFSFYVI